MKSIIGLKLGMTQIFDEKGNIVPVTLIDATPCQVTQIKTKDIDGYDAVQIGTQLIEKKNRIKKPQASKPFKFVREFRGLKTDEVKLGDKIDLTIFKEGEEVTVIGTSKGKGFQGPVKRHGFRGRLSTSHGTKHEMRTPGSTGSSMPERVVKGKKMAGHMGDDQVTIKNLKIAKIDMENNILALKGAVPGRKGTLLEISAK
jgi:large subunit ribosomal protein L3